MERGKFIEICDWVAAAALTALAASAVAVHAGTPQSSVFSGLTFDPHRKILGIAIGGWIHIQPLALLVGCVALLPNLRFVQQAPRLRGFTGAIAALVLLLYAVNRGPKPIPPYQAPVASLDASGKTFLNAWTLEKLNRIAGVPESYMRSRLNIPADASSVVPLSSLQESSHFTIDQVERAISDYNTRKKP